MKSELVGELNGTSPLSRFRKGNDILDKPYRYRDEFEWKYNRRKSTEGEKMEMVLKAAEGKRLQHR